MYSGQQAAGSSTLYSSSSSREYTQPQQQQQQQTQHTTNFQPQSATATSTAAIPNYSQQTGAAAANSIRSAVRSSRNYSSAAAATSQGTSFQQGGGVQANRQGTNYRSASADYYRYPSSYRGAGASGGGGILRGGYLSGKTAGTATSQDVYYGGHRDRSARQPRQPFPSATSSRPHPFTEYHDDYYQQQSYNRYPQQQHQPQQQLSQSHLQLSYQQQQPYSSVQQQQLQQRYSYDYPLDRYSSRDYYNGRAAAAGTRNTDYNREYYAHSNRNSAYYGQQQNDYDYLPADLTLDNSSRYRQRELYNQDNDYYTRGYSRYNQPSSAAANLRYRSSSRGRGGGGGGGYDQDVYPRSTRGDPYYTRGGNYGNTVTGTSGYTSASYPQLNESYHSPSYYQEYNPVDYYREVSRSYPALGSDYYGTDYDYDRNYYGGTRGGAGPRALSGDRGRRDQLAYQSSGGGAGGGRYLGFREQSPFYSRSVDRSYTSREPSAYQQQQQLSSYQRNRIGSSNRSLQHSEYYHPTYEPSAYYNSTAGVRENFSRPRHYSAGDAGYFGSSSGYNYGGDQHYSRQAVAVDNYYQHPHPQSQPYQHQPNAYLPPYRGGGLLANGRCWSAPLPTTPYSSGGGGYQSNYHHSDPYNSSSYRSNYYGSQKPYNQSYSRFPPFSYQHPHQDPYYGRGAYGSERYPHSSSGVRCQSAPPPYEYQQHQHQQHHQYYSPYHQPYHQPYQQQQLPYSGAGSLGGAPTKPKSIMRSSSIRGGGGYQQGGSSYSENPYGYSSGHQQQQSYSSSYGAAGNYQSGDSGWNRGSGANAQNSGTYGQGGYGQGTGYGQSGGYGGQTSSSAYDRGGYSGNTAGTVAATTTAQHNHPPYYGGGGHGSYDHYGGDTGAGGGGGGYQHQNGYLGGGSSQLHHQQQQQQQHISSSSGYHSGATHQVDPHYHTTTPYQQQQQTQQQQQQQPYASTSSSSYPYQQQQQQPQSSTSQYQQSSGMGSSTYQSSTYGQSQQSQQQQQQQQGMGGKQAAMGAIPYNANNAALAAVSSTMGGGGSSSMPPPPNSLALKSIGGAGGGPLPPAKNPFGIGGPYGLDASNLDYYRKLYYPYDPITGEYMKDATPPTEGAGGLRPGDIAAMTEQQRMLYLRTQGAAGGGGGAGAGMGGAGGGGMFGGAHSHLGGGGAYGAMGVGGGSSYVDSAGNPLPMTSMVTSTYGYGPDGTPAEQESLLLCCDFLLPKPSMTCLIITLFVTLVLIIIFTVVKFTIIYPADTSSAETLAFVDQIVVLLLAGALIWLIWIFGVYFTSRRTRAQIRHLLSCSSGFSRSGQHHHHHQGHHLDHTLVQDYDGYVYANTGNTGTGGVHNHNHTHPTTTTTGGGGIGGRLGGILSGRSTGGASGGNYGTTYGRSGVGAGGYASNFV